MGMGVSLKHFFTHVNQFLDPNTPTNDMKQHIVGSRPNGHSYTKIICDFLSGKYTKFALITWSKSQRKCECSKRSREQSSYSEISPL
jgi:hypothetical protein